MADRDTIDDRLDVLEGELKRLEVEYELFFSGRSRRAPHDRHTRVDAEVKRLGRRHVESTAARFRLQTLQHRYYTWSSRWGRELRATEEGVAGPGRASKL